MPKSTVVSFQAGVLFNQYLQEVEFSNENEEIFEENTVQKIPTRREGGMIIRDSSFEMKPRTYRFLYFYLEPFETHF